MTLLAQVRRTITEHHLFSPGDTVIVAVSGGPDSLALLHVLRAVRDELGIALHVAHVNHQLRGAASDVDAEFVANLAREWNLPATIEARDVAAHAKEHKLSIEEAARQVRYAFLAEVAQRVGARAVAVGHNADDQVETVLMHLLRGAGMAGLRGIEFQVSGFRFQVRYSDLKPETLNLKLVRPLLDVTRADIEAYCTANALTPRFDVSNLDRTFFRNRLRHEVLPYLERLNPNLRAVLRRTARALADDYAFLQAQVAAAYARVAREQEDAITFALQAWRGLHPALQRGTLRMAVQKLRGDLRNIDWTHIEDARRAAQGQSTGAQATLPAGLLLRVGYTEFTIAAAEWDAPQHDLPWLNADELALAVPGKTALPDSDWVVETEIPTGTVAPVTEDNRWIALLDLDKTGTRLALRRRRAGDRFQPAGMGGHTKSVHEFMIDEKIPHAIRDRLPLLIAGERIIWVCGWRVDDRARPTNETTRVLRVTFRRGEAFARA